jgi:uncharacterized protein YcbX
VPEIDLRSHGAVGNREFFVVDEDHRLLSLTRTPAFVSHWSVVSEDGRLQVGRGADSLCQEVPALGNPVRSHFFADRFVEGHRVLGPWDELLSDVAGRRVHLVKAATPSGGFDVHPATLQSEASVAALGNEADGSNLDPRRFRALITCDGMDAFEEDTWSGRSALVGSSALIIGGSVRRCAAIQRHPADGSPGVNALRLIKDRRGVQTTELGQGLALGVYAQISCEGIVRVGDPVRPGPASVALSRRSSGR